MLASDVIPAVVLLILVTEPFIVPVAIPAIAGPSAPAMTRLMGLVLTALSIEMLVPGLGSVVDQWQNR